MGRPQQEPAGPLALAIAREVRKELGDRQKSGRWLAASIEKSESYVRARLAAKTDFTVNDVERICDAFEIDAIEFIARAEVATVSGRTDDELAAMDEADLRSNYDLAADQSVDTSDPELRQP